MKKILAIILLLFILFSFGSCAVINSLLGFDECNYPGCERTQLDNCNYCGFHCDSYTVPDNFNSKVGKSIDKQVRDYNSRRQSTH